MKVYLNGKFVPRDEARISALDRGFLFADAVYEVIPAYAGVPFRLEEHLARLERSLRRIHMQMPLDAGQWRTILRELLAQAGPIDQSVYLQISRGAGANRDHAIPKGIEPTVFVMAGPAEIPNAEQVANGIHAITLDDIRWDWCDIKSTALLANILLKQQAFDRGAQEAILIRDGKVTEGAASNVFIVKDGMIRTPANGNHLLSGITRDLVLELAAASSLPLEEADVTLDELGSADEVWITSSTKEVMAVTELNGQTIGNGRPGPIWKTVIDLFHEYVQTLRDQGRAPQ